MRVCSNPDCAFQSVSTTKRITCQYADTEILPRNSSELVLLRLLYFYFSSAMKSFGVQPSMLDAAIASDLAQSHGTRGCGALGCVGEMTERPELMTVYSNQEALAFILSPRDGVVWTSLDLPATIMYPPASDVQYKYVQTWPCPQI